MSTFTGLRISRFFLSLRTSALFPFYVLKSVEGYAIHFPPAPVINIEQKFCHHSLFSGKFATFDS
jgi:hypothetical protein